jgi:hypothetical protein
MPKHANIMNIFSQWHPQMTMCGRPKPRLLPLLPPPSTTTMTTIIPEHRNYSATDTAPPKSLSATQTSIAIGLGIKATITLHPKIPTHPRSTLHPMNMRGTRYQRSNDTPPHNHDLYLSSQTMTLTNSVCCWDLQDKRNPADGDGSSGWDACGDGTSYWCCCLSY